MVPATLEAFLQHDPASHPAPLCALWHDAHGDWNAAHAAAQADEQDPDSAWVHAFLHRKEGDTSNAAYWYRHADKPFAHGALEDEWSGITAALLAR